VSTERIETRAAVTAVDHLRDTPGLNVSTGGIAQSNVVARGFNNAFSGSLLMLQDYKFAGVPSLRVNVPFLVPGTQDDIERIEVLLGPASALYGPNSANGVLHVITKSPFTSQGTTVSLDGGERSILRAGLRHAGSLGSRAAFKVSGEYFTGRDFTFADPAEPSTFGAQAPTGRRGQPNVRDFDVERYSGEARLDVRPTENTEAVTTLGYSNVGNGIELTGANGASQIRNWTYTSLQQRFRWNRLFVQAFANLSDAGNENADDTGGTYLLRTGVPIVDKSRVLAAQLQHGADLFGGRQRFVYGADYIFTDPRTGNTINGRNEENDEVTEVGAYVQSTSQLHRKLDLITAFRADRNNRISGTQFSPRVALAYKPTGNHNLRVSFNRAFQTPANFSFFLDLPQSSNIGGLPYNIRARGNPPKEGWQYNRACTAAVSGGLCMRSPFVGGGEFGDASAARGFGGVITALQPRLVAGLVAAGIPQAQAQGIVQFLATRQPTEAQVPSRVSFINAATTAVDPASLRDIRPLAASYNNTYEAGYKG
jgi:iron complex outermembrane receptor protein